MMYVSWLAGRPGIGEILIIVLIVLLLFGAKKIPEIARSLGRSLTEFKKGREDGVKGEGAESDQKTESSQ